MNANKPPTEKTGGLRSGRSITRSDWEKPNNLSQTSAQHEYVCCRDKRLIMAVVGTAIMAVLMVAVVPKITSIFTGKGKELPLPTETI